MPDNFTCLPDESEPAWLDRLDRLAAEACGWIFEPEKTGVNDINGMPIHFTISMAAWRKPNGWLILSYGTYIPDSARNF